MYVTMFNVIVSRDVDCKISLTIRLLSRYLIMQDETKKKKLLTRDTIISGYEFAIAQARSMRLNMIKRSN